MSEEFDLASLIKGEGFTLVSRPKGTIIMDGEGKVLGQVQDDFAVLKGTVFHVTQRTFDNINRAIEAKH